ncbi:MAG: hypothetical protein DRJ03_31205 [Chloroflexi bacterium]|nr:MAG: hypothetical protein DRJ03_31205 [Chloroflexota bacterium]RLI51789.1 MAG: hypothetical protein DRP09_18885 [Candidatus Thorarchaeota archaeon]
MAKIIGHIREDQATYGEKRVLKTLASSLPADFYVYVECPLHDKDMERMPDFIVLTTFGVIVLEVKDWVWIIEADKSNVKIRTRKEKEHTHRNPVHIAREFAHILTQKLQQVPELRKNERKTKIPWGYAAVLPNLKPSIISRLRTVWGEPYVLALGDLGPSVVTKRLKATIPSYINYNLCREDICYVKSVIYPVVVFNQDDYRTQVLDEIQEEIVAEPPRVQIEKPTKPERAPALAEQSTLFTQEIQTKEPPIEESEDKPQALEGLMHNFSIRLVRGVAGSGKTLVLTQRAKYLAAQYPEWKIAVLTYNNRLTENLQASFKGVSNVKVTNFHKVCKILLDGYVEWRTPHNPDGWLNHNRKQWSVIQELGSDFVRDEIKWIKDIGIASRVDYLDVQRKGRGRGLQRERREQIYDVLESYATWLKINNSYDWGDVPHLVLKGIEAKEIEPETYDAVFIDEAQDFAPSWIEVVKCLLKPDSGLIFMTDDPSQSIYRYYSWQEKGIPVVGRTRWLRVPYRNTREIYQAAYEVIREDKVLKHNLEEQLGMTLEPDLNSAYLRSGPRPQMRGFRSPDAEFTFIRTQIEWLMQRGSDAREIAVLHRRKSGISKLQSALQGLGVEVSTFHALKGLEFEVVFLSQMQHTFPEGILNSEQSLSGERRLVYMAMTRARERLYLSYEGHWPKPLENICDYTDQAFA